MSKIGSDSGSRGIMVKDEKVLLILSKHNTWFLPGGGIENGESAEDALKRELLEEVNIGVNGYTWIGAKNDAVHWGKTEVWNYFLINDYSGMPEISDSVEREVLDLAWVKFDEVKRLLNLGWQTIDGLYFLAKKYPEYQRAYEEIKLFYDTRQNLSNPEPFFSDGESKPKTAVKMKLNEKLLSEIKTPIAVLYPPNLELIETLLKKYDGIDVLEVNPIAMRSIEKKFGEKVSMLDGVLDIPIASKKYNTILAIGCLGYVRYFPNFVYNINKFLNKGGLFVTSIVGSRIDIIDYDSLAKLLKAYGFSIRTDSQDKTDKLVVASKL